MLPWDDAITFMQLQAQDQTAAGLSFLKMMYNVYYIKILVEFGRQETEKKRTITLTTGKRGEQMPPDVLWPKTLELHYGSIKQPLFEEASDKTWTFMKSGDRQGIPTHFHYMPRFGIGGGIVEFVPIPSGSTYTVEMTYESNDKELSKSAYNAGSIGVTNGSVTIIGTGTSFVKDMEGRYFKVTDDNGDRYYYRINTFTDATHLDLENFYDGSTSNSLSYKIVEMPNLPADMHLLPAYGSLREWWSTKGNAAKTQEFNTNYVQGMMTAKKTHSVVTRDSIVDDESPLLPFGQYPSYYPLSIAG